MLVPVPWAQEDDAYLLGPCVVIVCAGVVLHQLAGKGLHQLFTFRQLKKRIDMLCVLQQHGPASISLAQARVGCTTMVPPGKGAMLHIDCGNALLQVLVMLA